MSSSKIEYFGTQCVPNTRAHPHKYTHRFYKNFSNRNNRLCLFLANRQGEAPLHVGSTNFVWKEGQKNMIASDK